MARRHLLLTVHGTGRGGAELLAAEEAEHLADAYDVLLAASDGALSERLAATGVVVAERPPSLPLWGDGPWAWLRSSVRTLVAAGVLARIIRRRRVDAVVVNSAVSMAPLLAARLAGVPSVLHVREWPQSRLAPALLRLQRRLATRTVAIADAMQPLLGGPGADLTIVHDGIDVRRPPRAPRGAFSTPLRLVLVGGLDPRKGQDVALRALAELRPTLPCELLLVGRESSAAYARQLRALAAELGIAELVTFAGESDDVAALLRESDVLVCSSRGEWTPLVLMEALMEGLPVIASDVGGVAEVVVPEQTGLLVAPERPAALAEAIRRVAGDPEAAAAMVRSGQRHVVGEFDGAATAAHVARLLERLMPG